MGVRGGAAVIARWWFAPAPAERLAALRILIGGFALVYVVVRMPELHAVARLPRAQFAPVGIVRLLGPLSPQAALVLAFATCGLLVAFVAGAAFRVTGPMAAIALLLTLTYRNAWGQVFHTENLLVLHVIGLACAPAADVWALDRRREQAGAGYGWPIKLLVALTAATYLLAGIAKLRVAGVAWIDGAHLRDQIAVDNLRKAVLGDRVAPLAIALLEHPAALAGLSMATLALELGAPIALLGGQIARAWAIAVWSFHVGVVLTMNIVFFYPLSGGAFLPLVRAERPFVWWLARRRRV